MKKRLIHNQTTEAKEMQFTKRHGLGIACGAATVVLAANIFHFFFGWEFLAFFAALIPGLEIGFFIGEPKTTIQMHRRVIPSLTKSQMVRFISNIPSKFAEALIVLGFAIIICGFVFWEVQAVIFVWDSTISPMLYNHPGVKIFVFLSTFLFVIVCYAGMLVFSLSEKQYQCRIHFFLNFGICFSPVIAPLFLLLLFLGIVFWVLISVAFLAAKNETASIAIGVFIGGACGVLYGWTNLEFFETSLVMILGASAGSLSGWAMAKIGNSDLTRFFPGYTASEINDNA